jgi:hypothetical protein
MEKQAYNQWKSTVLSTNKETKPGLYFGTVTSLSKPVIATHCPYTKIASPVCLRPYEAQEAGSA